MAIRRISSSPDLLADFRSVRPAKGGILFISGMPTLNAGGKFIPGTFDEEADRA